MDDVALERAIAKEPAIIIFIAVFVIIMDTTLMILPCVALNLKLLLLFQIHWISLGVYPRLLRDMMPMEDHRLPSKQGEEGPSNWEWRKQKYEVV